MTTPITVQDYLMDVEDVRYCAYQDSEGWWTIGVGRLIDGRKKDKCLSHKEVMYLLNNDIEERREHLEAEYPWFNGLNDVRRAVVISMSFQTGNLSHWPKFCAAMALGNYELAAEEMLDSKVAKEQAPARWARQAKMMTTGEWQ